MTIKTAVIRLTQEEFLSSIWYSDGSGARFGGVGMDSTPDSWRITDIALIGPDKIDVQIERQASGN